MNEIGALYIASDMDVTLTGASVAATGAFLNAGTVTFSLLSAGIRQVSGRLVASGSETVLSGPTAMAYIAASDGNYRGVMPSTVTALLTDRTYYYVDIVYTDGNYDVKFRLTCLAQYLGAPLVP